jgi:hypothetical protein
MVVADDAASAEKDQSRHVRRLFGLERKNGSGHS